MSESSSLKSFASGGPRPGGEGTGWDLLGYGWPAFLLLAGFAWGFAVTVGASQAPGESPYLLSREALSTGRWWTLVSHVFVHGGMGGAILTAALSLAGLTPTATANPGWMGGWRTPAVFLAAAWAGALAELFFAPTAILSGAWPAVLGLAAYYILSGRLASVIASDETKGSAGEKARGDGASVALNWANDWFLILGLGPSLGWFPSILPGEGLVAFAQGAAVVVGGAVAVYVLVKLGGDRGWRIASLAVQATSILLLLAVAPTFGRWLLGNSSEVMSLPWPSYVVGLAVGMTAALLERLRPRAPAL